MPYRTVQGILLTLAFSRYLYRKPPLAHVQRPIRLTTPVPDQYQISRLLWQ